MHHFFCIELSPIVCSVICPVICPLVICPQVIPPVIWCFPGPVHLVWIFEFWNSIIKKKFMGSIQNKAPNDISKFTDFDQVNRLSIWLTCFINLSNSDLQCKWNFDFFIKNDTIKRTHRYYKVSSKLGEKQKFLFCKQIADTCLQLSQKIPSQFGSKFLRMLVWPSGFRIR